MLLMTLLIVLAGILFLFKKVAAISRAPAALPTLAAATPARHHLVLGKFVAVVMFMGTVIFKIITFILDVWAESEDDIASEVKKTTFEYDVEHDGATWNNGFYGWGSLDADEKASPPIHLDYISHN